MELNMGNDSRAEQTRVGGALKHINFHIGAPRIASRIIQSLSKVKAVSETAYLQFLTPKAYKEHLRAHVNASSDMLQLAAGDRDAEEAFYRRLTRSELLVASQPAMMGHPRDVFREGLILPGAEERVARLSQLFTDQRLDLHLAITNQADYIRILQGDIDMEDVVQSLHDGTPSWHELIERLRRACPERRILVWDFEEPARIALPFAMTMLSVDEALIGEMREPIAEAIRVTALMPRILQRNVVPEDFLEELDAQYEDDLTAIEAMENMVLIRSNLIPEDLHLTID
jgi:hypothetical protein